MLVLREAARSQPSAIARQLRGEATFNAPKELRHGGLADPQRRRDLGLRLTSNRRFPGADFTSLDTEARLITAPPPSYPPLEIR